MFSARSCALGIIYHIENVSSRDWLKQIIKDIQTYIWNLLHGTVSPEIPGPNKIGDDCWTVFLKKSQFSFVCFFKGTNTGQPTPILRDTSLHHNLATFKNSGLKGNVYTLRIPKKPTCLFPCPPHLKLLTYLNIQGRIQNLCWSMLLMDSYL